MSQKGVQWKPQRCGSACISISSAGNVGRSENRMCCLYRLGRSLSACAFSLHFSWSPHLQLPPFCLFQFICFRLLSNSTCLYPYFLILRHILCLSYAFVSIYLCIIYNLRHITGLIGQNCWRFWLNLEVGRNRFLAHRFHCSTLCITHAHVTNLPCASCLQGNCVQVAYTVYGVWKCFVKKEYPWLTGTSLLYFDRSHPVVLYDMIK
jgi:hypothetical protein